MLCKVCQETIRRQYQSFWDLQRPNGFENYDSKARQHHRSLKSFHDTLSSTECYICHMFWVRINTWAKNKIYEHGRMRSALGHDALGDQLGKGDWLPLVTGMELRPITNTEDENYSLTMSLDEDNVNFQIAVRDNMAQDVSIRFVLDGASRNPPESIGKTTKRSEIFKLARNWVTDCVNNHESCTTPSTPSVTKWYPTRLLDLGRPDLPRESICLIETLKTVPKGRYMTLSHCWGDVSHLTLNKRTYSSLLEGISLASLRQVFQDTIYIARMLSTRYLWIDALCIFQDKDDLADWSREASKMQDVYANSYCNISALDTPDGTNSLFQRRNPSLIITPTIEINAMNKEGLTGKTDTFMIHDYQFWESQVSSGIIHSRAWVVQERLLSPRILHFGRQQVFWECSELKAAEIYPDKLPSFIPARPVKTLTSRISAESDEKRSLQAIWWSIIETYTKCNLTKPSDKLIACSGLAKRLGVQMNDEYVAGLWRFQLERQLLWKVSVSPWSNLRKIGDTLTPKEYRAPSWSWASLDGPISLYSGEDADLQNLATIEKLSIDTNTNEEFGSVRGAALHIRGVLKQIDILEPTNFEGYKIQLTWRIRLRDFDVDTEMGGRNSKPSIVLDVLEEDFHRENQDDSLFLMPIVKSPQSIDCLLLQLLDENTAEYCRIGFSEWRLEDSNREKVEHYLIGDADITEAEFPCHEFRDGLHLITLG